MTQTALLGTAHPEHHPSAYPLWKKLCLLTATYPGFGRIDSDISYLMGCSKLKQFVSTLRSMMEPDRFCAFCNPAMVDNPPIFENDLCALKWNDFPKRGLQMLLIFPKAHLTGIAEVTPDHWAKAGELFQKACWEFNLTGGGIVARFGDSRFHAGTMPHFHWNIICPDGSVEYRAPLSKTEPDRERNYKRLLGMIAEVKKLGGYEWLRSGEMRDFPDD
ncbi:MAG TPA: hypothetical protein VD967_03450 [Candidatus Paceibacterota bacterium]|nr:hypothetical protein [Candidatus Paceibacterota bacterium]